MQRGLRERGLDAEGVERDRQTDRQTDRARETDRQTETERQRERVGFKRTSVTHTEFA